MGVTTPTSEYLRFPGGGWHGITWQEWGEGEGEPPLPDPVATFTVDPEPSTLGDEVTFDATDSTPSPGISAYEWEVATVPGDTGAGPVFGYAAPVTALHVMRLIVRLPDGRSNQAMRQFNVNPPPAPDPEEPETRRVRRGEP